MFLTEDTVLEVDRVSKIYARSRATTQRRLGRTLLNVLSGKTYSPNGEKLGRGEFHAVKDVSFSLKRGEALGIIGLNGSGKTTLLRMLAGQILPDSGSITVMGRTASMIDLTAGFQPAASGRENVFLRGAALGRSRAQMQADLEAILDFAELGDAIDAPVASYSSGMTMRLAFSIISTVAPDLLFIDEVLAVGDFRFRQKCLARVRELREHSAFVMVSHSMSDIARFCEETIVMRRGVIAFKGPSALAVEFFENEEEVSPHTSPPSLVKVMGPNFENSRAIKDVSASWMSEDGSELTEIIQGEPVTLYVRFTCQITPYNLILGVPIWNAAGTLVSGFSTDVRFPNIRRKQDGTVEIALRIPSFSCNPDVYHGMLGIVDGSEFLWRMPIPTLQVKSTRYPTWGTVSLDYEWRQTP